MDMPNDLAMFFKMDTQIPFAYLLMIDVKEQPYGGTSHRMDDLRSLIG